MKNTIEKFKTCLVLFALSLSSFVAACSDNEEAAAPEIIIPEAILTNGITFSKTGGTNTLNIKSNVAVDVTSSAPDWCKVTAETSASSTIFKYTIAAEANTLTDNRDAVITVMGGGTKVGEFTVRQTAADGLIVDPAFTSFNVPAAGGTISVKLTTNGDVQVAPGVSWITVANTRAMAEKTFTFTVSPNYLEERNGGITFTLGDLTETVTVRQAAGEGGVMVSDAITLAGKMYAGINIGNTLEAPGGETAWSNPRVNQTYISSLKALGFNAVRIPCAWSSHLINETTYEIDPAWLDRVSEVVGYCVSNDMYAIVNIHWDGGWLEDAILGGYSEAIDTKQRVLWTQIAEKLNGYDERLLFAGCNEPGMNETSLGTAFDATSVATIMRYEQTFVDAVRSTGGNNASRCLIVQAPATRIDDCFQYFSMPQDNVANRLMLEIHFYAPYNFCLMENDADWGNTAWYWGEANHVSGSAHNAQWGEEAYVAEELAKMKTGFVDKGIPVIIGEYSAMKRTINENQEAHDRSRGYWSEVVTREAKNNGIVPFHWETGGVINRTTGAVTDHYVIDGIMKGAAEGRYPY